MGYLLVDPKPPVPLEVLSSNFSASSKETSSGFKKIICAILSPILMSTSEAAKLLDHTWHTWSWVSSTHVLLWKAYI